MRALLGGFAAGLLAASLACGLLPAQEITGHAARSCQSDSRAFFNPCATLDPSQIQDRR